MIVDIDERSGFCFGVKNAVDIAEKALAKGEKVFCLGQIVHNDLEVERLSSLGLISVNHDQFRELTNCKVLIRAHGEPPETYNIAKKNNITIIEATCPIVKKLQSKIKETWLKTKADKGQVAIFGKSGHAEVAGLLGQTKNKAILINGEADIDKIDVTRPVYLFSQTTMGVADYAKITGIIRSRILTKRNNPDKLLHVYNTICSEVSCRQPRLKKFAESHEVIIFVSGKESSNGRMLNSVCKSVNPETYFVSSPEEIDKAWFRGRKSVGICGATSTPKWLIDKIKDIISNI